MAQQQGSSVIVPGDSVAERLAYWRAMSWEELVALMTSDDGSRTVSAEVLAAPLVPARINRV